MKTGYLSQNLKFWTYLNGSPVRLTLRPGQTVRHFAGSPDDEGWSSESIIWKHAGTGIYCESFTEGRDCDGYSSRWADSFCPAEGLSAGATLDGITYPRWDHSTEECTDSYAESMGY